MNQTDAPARDQPGEGAHAPDDVDADGRGVLDRGPVGRRTLMKGIGATAAGAVALGSDYGMVDDAEAIAPVVLYGGAVLGAAAVGWAVREYEVIGSNPPAEGLTASALKADVYQTARTRKSTNASMFVDNQNIINSGLPNTLYVEGKIAAIEALNAGKTQAEVETAAHNAMNKYAATIESNLLKSWNESVSETWSLWQTLSSHADVTANNILRMTDNGGGTYTGGTMMDPANHSSSITLADGTSMSVRPVYMEYDSWEKSGSSATNRVLSVRPDSFNAYDPDSTDVWVNVNYDGKTLQYHSYLGWNGIWSDLQTAISDVQSGLTTWVNNVYSNVQAGEIEVSELVTPRERAKMMATDGGTAQAIADLVALGVPVDAGNKYTITMEDTGATIRGTLALTSESQTIEPGTTYNPSSDTFSGDAFFTYNVATGSGDWSAFEEGIDGGVLSFTQKPYQKTEYEVTTSYNETVTVQKGNFTAVDSNGNEVDPQNATAWEADLSDQLENDIANVKEVDFFANTTEDQFETLNLSSSFTVEKIEDASTGEEVDSANFEQTTAQTDSNYVTQEEWDQLQQKNEELIEKYEESQSTGGGGIDLGQFDMFGLPGEAVALIAGALAIFFGKK